jgi:signal peptidase II
MSERVTADESTPAGHAGGATDGAADGAPATGGSPEPAGEVRNPDNIEPAVAAPGALPHASAGARSLLWLLVSVLVIVLDQYTKYLVMENLVEFQRINILPVFDLVRFHNTGAAFSLLADAGGWQHWLFTAIAVGVSLGIVWYQWSLPARGVKTLALGLALVLGGAVGNLIDRIMHGYVVDFLLVYYGAWSWPAFNVADSAISVGVALIIFDSLFFERRRNEALS